MTNKVNNRTKHKLRRVRSWTDFRSWWNEVVDVKVKAIALTGMIATFVIVGFQYQVNALTNERLDSVCELRVAARTDLRETLFKIVNLTDVLSQDPTAREYTANRVAIINETTPILTTEDCA